MHVNSMNIIEQEAINQLKNDPYFLNSRTFRKQVGIACSHLRTEYSRISYSRITAMFDVNKGTIKDQEKKYQMVALRLSHMMNLACFSII